MKTLENLVTLSSSLLLHQVESEDSDFKALRDIFLKLLKFSRTVNKHLKIKYNYLIAVVLYCFEIFRLSTLKF